MMAVFSFIRIHLISFNLTGGTPALRIKTGVDAGPPNHQTHFGNSNKPAHQSVMRGGIQNFSSTVPGRW